MIELILVAVPCLIIGAKFAEQLNGLVDPLWDAIKRKISA